MVRSNSNDAIPRDSGDCFTAFAMINISSLEVPYLQVRMAQDEQSVLIKSPPTGFDSAFQLSLKVDILLSKFYFGVSHAKSGYL